MSVCGDDVNIIHKQKILSNKDLCKETKILLDSLVDEDVLLKDISSETTYEEILDKIALVKGQSISIVINRGNLLPPFDIVVSEKKATVLDLKNCIKKSFQLEQKRLNEKNNKKLKRSNKFCTKISWKYIWRTYQLDYNGQNLHDDNRLISDYGIKNKTILNFVKKYRKK